MICEIMRRMAASRPAGMVWRVLIVLPVLVLSAMYCLGSDEPPGTGLLVRLDASAAESIERNGESEGSVTRWRDLSGHQADATVPAWGQGPTYVEKAVGELAGLRFTGRQVLAINRPDSQLRSLHVFVVWRPHDGQTVPASDQRLLSSAYGMKQSDSELPGWNLTAEHYAAASGGILCSEAAYEKAAAASIGLGCHLRSGRWGLVGDVGEVLIYDAQAAGSGAMEQARRYLKQKWGVRSPEVDPGWTRNEEVKQWPKRTNDRWPLSDQENRGHWQPLEAIWDEFSASAPDSGKWWLTSRTWKGREPVTFDEGNVSTRNGDLVLQARGPLTGDVLAKLPQGFTYTSGFVRSRETFRYGYVEVRAKVADCSLTSALFLMDTTARESTEIDVFEITGGVPAVERRFNMTGHVMKLPGLVGTEDDHPRATAHWIAPFRFADDYHVYGLEWKRESISWYVDGVLLHRARNTLWHQPLRVILDLECQQRFRDNPMNDRLPAEYRVDYVRVWTEGTPPTSRADTTKDVVQ